MTKQQELLNDIQSKLQLLSTYPVISPVEERIKKKIQELKDEFYEKAKRSTYADFIDHNNLTYESAQKIYDDNQGNCDAFGVAAMEYLDQTYGLYYSDIEELVDTVQSFEKLFFGTRHQIRNFEELLGNE